MPLNPEIKEFLGRVNIKRLNYLTASDDTFDKSDISYQNLKEAEKSNNRVLPTTGTFQKMKNLT